MYKRQYGETGADGIPGDDGDRGGAGGSGGGAEPAWTPEALGERPISDRKVRRAHRTVTGTSPDSGPSGAVSYTHLDVYKRQPLGFLDLSGLAAVPVEQLATVPATAVLVRPPTGWVVLAEPGDDASAVVIALAGHVEGEIVKDVVLVRDAAGRLQGTVSLADVEAALG